MNALTRSLVLIVTATIVSQTHAQFLVPIPPRPVPTPTPMQACEVQRLSIEGTIRDQIAQIQVTHTIYNPNDQQMETQLLLPLPDAGAVQSLVLMVDGKEFPGKLLPAEEAKAIYEQIVRSQRDPALLEFVGQGLYRVSVFPVPGKAKRTLTLSYTMVLPRDYDVVQFQHPLTPQQQSLQLKEFSLHLDVQSTQPLKNLFSPSHELVIQRKDDHHAVISLTRNNAPIAGTLRVLYSVGEGDVGATLMSYKAPGEDDGYFLLLASPQVPKQDKPVSSKTVVCVIDRSGSMSGTKIEQARNALKFVVHNLNEGDLFNIIAYDDKIQSFKPELVQLTGESRQEAVGFVEGLRAGGATNIDAAMRAAMTMLQQQIQPSYVLFLTDGLPTVGERNEMAIAANCRQANQSGARVFAFGVGYDLNARLLDRITSGNGGVSEYVKPDEDIEASVSRFYAKFTSPVLSNIGITLADTDVNHTYPRTIPDLFDGGQLLWVGRYVKPTHTTIKLTGKVNDKTHTYEFSGQLAKTTNESNAFVARIWATRRIADIIDELDLKGRNAELITELVELSKKHGILTPYTSFLADETNENLVLNAAPAMQLASEATRDLDQITGKIANDQRAFKNVLAQTSVAGSVQPASPSSWDGYNETPDQAQAQRVRNIAGKTFFNVQSRWVEGGITEDEENNATEIEMFSEPYFELVNQLPAQQRQYVTFNESVTVRLNNKVYRIVRPG